MERGRDRRYDDSREMGDEPYRSSRYDEPQRGGRGGYRGYRSPPRRERTPPRYEGSYGPPRDNRRRSRSPVYSGRGGPEYGGRPRSPRRGYSPRRDDRPRSPPRNARRYSRSPIRARSPVQRRRDPSPYERRPRSPYPLKRPVSPPRNRYDDRRGYSPPRGNRPRFPNENNYRPGERSPSPPPRRSEHVSRIPSPMSSRRSSPPIHPDRIAQTGSRSPGYYPARGAHGPKDLGYRDRSPPRQAYSPDPQASARRESPNLRERPPGGGYEESRNGYTPTGPAAAYRNGDSKQPPRGPSYDTYNREPPSGPPPSALTSISAHSRPTSNPAFSAPLRPRGSASQHRPDSREAHYGSSHAQRGGRLHSTMSYHGGPPPGRDARPPSNFTSNGPHSSYGRGGGGRGAPMYDSPAHEGPRDDPGQRHGPPFRVNNNSSSTTYPRTQRFNPVNHLASLPTIVPGGKALPAVDPAADRKISQLEEDAKRLRDMIEEKQREKRAGLREWGNRERESRRDGLRSELAEQQLQDLSGETIGGNAF